MNARAMPDIKMASLVSMGNVLRDQSASVTADVQSDTPLIQVTHQCPAWGRTVLGNRAIAR